MQKVSPESPSNQTVARRDKGDGSIYQARERGPDGEWRLSSVWTIRYSQHGKRRKESSGSDDFKVAKKLLAKRLSEIQRGDFVPDADKLTFEDLVQPIFDDYARNGRKLRRLHTSLSHLRPYFTRTKAKLIGRQIDRT